MTKKDIKHVSKTLAVLVGQPLRKIGRNVELITINFDKLIQSGDDKLGKYEMGVLCNMRFTYGDKIIFASNDVFHPTEEQANKPGFIWDTFDWQILGNTMFDEIVEKHFNGKFCDYIVKSVKINKFGDLTIKFENNFIIEFFADGSGYSENWRFGEANSSDSMLILTGNGNQAN